MINTKSIAAVKQQPQIVSNIMELSKTLSFYDRLLKNNPDMRDVTSDLAPAQRKAKWNTILTVEKASYDASVINITTTTTHASDSIQLAKKTARTLFDTSAFYYNVKNDVDLRLIDGPITRTQVSNWFWLLLLSIVMGFSASGMLEYLVFGEKRITIKKPDFSKMNSLFDFKKNADVKIEDELESLNNLYQEDLANTPFVFNDEHPAPEEISAELPDSKNYDEKFQEIKKITKKLEPGKYPNFPELPTEHKQPSAAPDNLPVADDAYFSQYLQPVESVPANLPVQIEEQQPSIDTKKEPTPEELKKRLNELLKGKI
jgi:hypothetical protein